MNKKNDKSSELQGALWTRLVSKKCGTKTCFKIKYIHSFSHDPVPTYSQNTVQPMARGHCLSAGQSERIFSDFLRWDSQCCSSEAGGGVCVHSGDWCSSYRWGENVTLMLPTNDVTGSDISSAISCGHCFKWLIQNNVRLWLSSASVMSGPV